MHTMIKLFRGSSMNHHRRFLSSLPTAFVQHKSKSIHQTTKIKPSTHIAKPSTISLPNYCRSMSSIFQSTLTTNHIIESNESTTSTSTNIIIDELNLSQREATLRPRYSITRVIAGPGAGSKYLLCFFFCLLYQTFIVVFNESNIPFILLHLYRNKGINLSYCTFIT